MAVPALLMATLWLAACGGGSGSDAPGQVTPTGAVQPQPGPEPGAGVIPGPPEPDLVAPPARFLTPPPALFKDQALVVAFSEPMDAGSLALTGDLAAVATPNWNATADTLTLVPAPSGWPRGPGHTLGLTARDKAGNGLAPLQSQFLVRLDFSHHQPAAAVIGQQAFDGVYANQPFPPARPSGRNLGSPIGNPYLSPDGRLVIPDTGNHRLLVFNAIPAVNDAPASGVIGQPDFSTNLAVIDSAHRLQPRGMAVLGDRFIVSEYGADRVAVYAQSPLADAALLPSAVLGVSDFTTDTRLGVSFPPCNASRLLQPTGIAVTPDGKLLVADSGHNRVLVWNQIPLTSGQPADLVLGQPDFTSCDANAPIFQGGASLVSNRSLAAPVGLWTDGTRLVVIDAGNHRALIWNSFPRSNFQPADLVLGQPDFTTARPVSTPTAATVSSGNAAGGFYGEVTSNGVQLVITDPYAYRVLLWNNFPTRNFQPADGVLGQASFTESVIATSQRSLYFPVGVLLTSDHLLVSNGHRVSVFKSN